MSDENEHVILVDEKDAPIGVEEKLTAHQQGLLHRAFSVYIFNDAGKLLLQQRAQHKYHSGGLWTNTCCSHPRPGEDTIEAAHRRLQEEMGFDCELDTLPSTTYRTEVPPDLTEHEFLHVFVGIYNENPDCNPEEAAGHTWVDVDALQDDMKSHPEEYTAWFHLCLPHVVKYSNT